MVVLIVDTNEIMPILFVRNSNKHLHFFTPLTRGFFDHIGKNHEEFC